MKHCKKCGELLPLEAFYKVDGTRDGHRGKCIECHLEEVSQNRDITAGPIVSNAYVGPMYQILFQPEDWKQNAACASDSNINYNDYFPDEDGNISLTHKTKREKCAACPVAWECLEYSDRTEATSGLWGGMQGDTRRRFLNSVDIRSPRGKHKHAAYLTELREANERVSA